MTACRICDAAKPLKLTEKLILSENSATFYNHALATLPNVCREKMELELECRRHAEENKQLKQQLETTGRAISADDLRVAANLAASLGQDLGYGWPNEDEYKQLADRFEQAAGTNKKRCCPLCGTEAIDECAAYCGAISCGLPTWLWAQVQKAK